MIAKTHTKPDSSASASQGNNAADQPTGKPVRIGDLLLERGIITQEQIEKALAYQKGNASKKLLGEILVELKYVTQELVLEILAETFDVPFARLSTRVVDASIIGILDRQFLEKQLVLPLFLIAGKLTIAIHEPTNVFLVEEVERLANVKVQVVAATAKDIKAVQEKLLSNNSAFVIDDVLDDIGDSDIALVDNSIADITDLEAAAGDSPIIKIVNYIIACAVEERASDIHIEPDDGHLRIRLRVDGQMFEKIKPPYSMAPAIASRIKIMAGMDISERRVPQDGGISVMVHQNPVDIRVSTMPGKFGEKVVMRIIDKRNAVTSLDSLGFSPKMLEDFTRVTEQPNGVVLVTGPTGSGKSTTLYGVLNQLNSDAVNVSTVEDPVEYNLKGVNQFQTNERAGFTFGLALRALLRQDPDIVMVGEIRDPETAKIATQAALTGHLVLSTLHTNDAPSAITRLVNIGVESYLVAASIRGVLAQRLVRKICTHCKQVMEMDDRTNKLLARLVGDASPIDTLYHGAGCKQCHKTGYLGRVGIYELFVPNDEILDAISRGATLQELRKLALASGQYTTLKNDGLLKLEAGLTTLEQLIAIVSS